MEILEVLSQFTNFSTIVGIFFGVAFGIIGGALPGISPSMTIALLLPVTLYLPKVTAIAVLMGSYQGAMFGGSISAVLINTPGTASAAATALDGYPMAQKGQAKRALQTALYASCFGGIIGTIILLVSAQFLAKVALKFGPPEYFGLMLLSLALIAGISGKSMLKGIISGGIGLFFATVGLDPIYGSTRFTFGTINLYDGINTLSVFIGVFALSEIMIQLSFGREELNKKPIVADSGKNRLKLKEFLSQKFNMLISAVIGALIGILPGIGGSTASFMAYIAAQKRSKRAEEFGTGIIDGIAAAESANNAVCGGALVPMLTLGIPGDVVTAILVGALISHGIKPGPLLFVEEISNVYTVYIALFFAVIGLFLVGTFGVPVFSKVVIIRKSILLPLVFIICIIGTYASKSNYFDVFVMLFMGCIGFALRKNKYPIPPLVIAFVIGRSLESNLRRSLILNSSGALIFFSRPLSAVLIIVAIIFTIFMVRSNFKSTKKKLAKSN
ncbi:MAG: tripartite tricarboxylate transporter permease [Candidatus Caldatribacteriota bacterium]